MKQVLQYRRSGATRVVDVPAPMTPEGGLLVLNEWSLISPGTERMLVEAGGANLVSTAFQRKDLVKQVVDKAARDGIPATIEAVRSRLDVAIPLGYSCAGTVLDVGAGAQSAFARGDRVACAGAGQANHAEVVGVAKNLAVRVPESVSLDDAAFVTVGAIALQGVRIADVRLGEACVVIGLGLVGQLTVQLLKAAGCRVFGIDIAQDKVDLARTLGADDACLRSDADLAQRVRAFSLGRGGDAILITAAASSSDPVQLAPSLARDRAVVVAVGLIGMDVPRNAYYEKELQVRLSRSYGPGRYDRTYEEDGVDYPVGYVRWTEQRNMEAFLDLVAAGTVRPSRLVTHRVPIAEAERAYQVVTGALAEPYLGILLRYPADPIATATVVPVRGATPTGVSAPVADQSHLGEETSRILDPSATGVGSAAVADQSPRGGDSPLEGETSRTLDPRGGDSPLEGKPSRAPVTVTAPTHTVGEQVRLGVIGAGSFARGVLLPALKKLDVDLRGVATASSPSAQQTATRFGFAYAASDWHHLVEDPRTSAVLIATRHDLHAEIAIAALQAGKDVFVEKPLAMDEPSLEAVMAAWRISGGRILQVGFNRRFAPTYRQAKAAFAKRRAPLVMSYRVNAGAVGTGSWVVDPRQGGGRLIGEVCHMVDVLQDLVGAPVTSVFTQPIAAGAGDDVLLTLTFGDGSLGTIVYASGGDRSLPKEHLEVLGGGVAAVLDDFRTVHIHAGGRAHRGGGPLPRQDKGHAAELAAFLDAARWHKPSPVDALQAEHVTRVTFAAVESARTGLPVAL